MVILVEDQGSGRVVVGTVGAVVGAGVEGTVVSAGNVEEGCVDGCVAGAEEGTVVDAGVLCVEDGTVTEDELEAVGTEKEGWEGVVSPVRIKELPPRMPEKVIMTASTRARALIRVFMEFPLFYV